MQRRAEELVMLCMMRVSQQERWSVLEQKKGQKRKITGMNHPDTGRRGKKEVTYTAVILKKRLQTAILLGITVIVLMAATHGVVSLKQYLTVNTQKYVNDISKSMTENLHDIFELKRADILTVADSIEQIRVEKFVEVKEFLERKAEKLDFDMMILLNHDRKYIITGGDDSLLDLELEEITELEGVQKSFEGNVKISYLGGQNLYYSCPVERNGENTDVLIGIRSKEKMQQIIEAKNFDSDCISFILNSEGNLLLTPVNTEALGQIEMIFDHNMDLVQEEAERIADVASGERDSDSHFISGGDREYYITYNSLGINDWMLATVVPEETVAGDANQYIYFFYVLLIIVALTFLGFWIVLLRSHEVNRQSLIRQGFTDRVTGGANKAAFLMAYQELFGKRNMEEYSIVFMNVVDFKRVNDEFGMAEGNEVLAHIYRVIESHLRADQDEFAARGEMDHFFICIKAKRPEIIKNRLEKIVTDINSFLCEDSFFGAMDFTMGICPIDEISRDATVFLDRARMASQKRISGRGERYVFYD